MRVLPAATRETVPVETPAAPAPAQPDNAAAPAQSATDAAAPAAGSETTHAVVKGDTYWDIAEKAYGDGAEWKRISQANPEYQPRRLPVGLELKIPAK